MPHGQAFLPMPRYSQRSRQPRRGRNSWGLRLGSQSVNEALCKTFATREEVELEVVDEVESPTRSFMGILSDPAILLPRSGPVGLLGPESSIAGRPASAEASSSAGPAGAPSFAIVAADLSANLQYAAHQIKTDGATPMKNRQTVLNVWLARSAGTVRSENHRDLELDEDKPRGGQHSAEGDRCC